MSRPLFVPLDILGRLLETLKFMVQPGCYFLLYYPDEVVTNTVTEYSMRREVNAIACRLGS